MALTGPLGENSLELIKLTSIPVYQFLVNEKTSEKPVTILCALLSFLNCKYLGSNILAFLQTKFVYNCLFRSCFSCNQYQ